MWGVICLICLPFGRKKKVIEELTERQISWLYFSFLFFFFLKVGRLLANGHGMNEYDRITGGTTTGAD